MRIVDRNAGPKGAHSAHIDAASGADGTPAQADERVIPDVGPCLDTASETIVGTGTAGIRSNDNDLDASGTRANAFGNALSAQVVNDEGDASSYIARFQGSDRCYIPEAGPPASGIERKAGR